MGLRRSLTLHWFPAFVLALLLGTAGVATAVATVRSRDDDRRRAAAEALAARAAELDADTTLALSVLALPEAVAGTPQDRAAATRGVLTNVHMVDGDDAADDDDLAVLFERARDEGSVQLSDALVAAAPVYREGEPATTVAERRDAIDGFVVATFDLDVDGVTLMPGGVHEEQSGTVSVPLDIAGREWTVEAPVEKASRTPAVVIITLALALGAGVVFAARRARQEVAATAAEADERVRQLRLVGDAGTLLQRSLDLAEVLPALAVLLSDQLDLAGTSILVADERGRLVEVFAMGRRPATVPRSVAELRRTPTELAAGSEGVLALERGGRTVGAVAVLPKRHMDEGELRTTAAVAELTGSAIANAQAFERELASARQLLELDHLKTEFLSTVSHELRTPVAAIVGFSSLLRDRDDQLDAERRADLLTRIVRNAESLSTLVNGLLDFARVERRSLQLEAASHDLSALVRDVVEQTETLFEQHTLMVDAPDGVMAAVDPYAIERIVSNLLTNAAKYSPPGTRIDLLVAHQGGHAVIEVLDHGPGIPAEERARVFSRFYRGNHETARGTRGAGVGLAVVKELAERLGGSVEASEAPSGGARLVVRFPIPTTVPA